MADSHWITIIVQIEQKMNAMRPDSSDWSHMGKQQIRIQFKTTYESDPGLIWGKKWKNKNKIWFCVIWAVQPAMEKKKSEMCCFTFARRVNVSLLRSTRPGRRKKPLQTSLSNFFPNKKQPNSRIGRTSKLSDTQTIEIWLLIMLLIKGWCFYLWLLIYSLFTYELLLIWCLS